MSRELNMERVLKWLSRPIPWSFCWLHWLIYLIAVPCPALVLSGIPRGRRAAGGAGAEAGAGAAAPSGAEAPLVETDLGWSRTCLCIKNKRRWRRVVGRGGVGAVLCGFCVCLCNENCCAWALGGSVSLRFAAFDNNCFEVSLRFAAFASNCFEGCICKN